MSEEVHDAELAYVRDVVRRRGWNATSYQILNPGFAYWLDRRLDAAAGYVARHGVRVVGGAPVCADAVFGDAVRAFEEDAARASCDVVYFAAEERVAELALSDDSRATFVIGAQPVWGPAELAGELTEHRSLRAQLHRARNKGVHTELPARSDLPLAELHRCLREWIERRGLPPLHFLIETQTLDHLVDRRIFVARRGDHVVGFLTATPIPARNGWLIEQLVRGDDAVNGMAELLIAHAAEVMAEEGAQLVTMGLAPLAQRGHPLTDRAPAWVRVLLRALRAQGRRFYDFEGLERFKAKFGCAMWQPVYMSASPGTSLPRAFLGVAAAFSGEPLLRFAPRAAFRAMRSALRPGG